MTFALIDVDGTLTIVGDRATGERVAKAMPSDCWAMVQTTLWPPLCGFVDDAGHVTGLTRNPVGAVLLAYLGARAMGNPYCGPVVLTGWEDTDPLGDESEIRDLSPEQVAFLQERHGQLSAVLAGRDEWFTPEHRAEMLAYAEFVRTADAPETTIMSGDLRDLLRLMRGVS